MSDGKMELEIHRQIRWYGDDGVGVDRELNPKAKLSIYQSTYAPTFTYGHGLWVVTERMRSRIREAKMSFLRRVLGSSLEIG